MKVYIATGYENRFVYGVVSQALQEAGHTVTYDWTVHNTRDDPKLVALADMTGVLTADLVLVLLPGALGTHLELGAAIGAGLPVLIWAETREPFDLPGIWKCPFYEYPLIKQITGSLQWLADTIADPNFLEAQRLIIKPNYSYFCFKCDQTFVHPHYCIHKYHPEAPPY